MTTRLDLYNLCCRRLGDLTAPYGWSELQINQWINDALADASLHLPRLLSVTLEAVADEHIYPLPAGYLAITRVEYPAGRSSPQYLQRLSVTEADFWELPGRYDVWETGNGGAASPAELALSDSPLTGEMIGVTYLSEYASLDDDGDLCSLPDRHLDLVVLFVRWAALQELASREARNPDPTTNAISVLDANTARAEQTYRQALAAAVRSESRSMAVGWRRAGMERIY